MKIGFGHFPEFGTSDGLDIAYYDSTKRFSTFGHGNRSCIIKGTGKAFFVIFWFGE